MQWTPPVVSQSASNSTFSEERALLHVQNLTKTARLVSHPDIEAGAQYILKVLQEIADIAAGRTDLIVEVSSDGPYARNPPPWTHVLSHVR